MHVTFCPLILQVKSKDLEFAPALQASTCAQGQYELVYAQGENVVYHCAWWDQDRGDCAVHYLSRVGSLVERGRGGGKI